MLNGVAPSPWSTQGDLRKLTLQPNVKSKLKLTATFRIIHGRAAIVRVKISARARKAWRTKRSVKLVASIKAGKMQAANEVRVKLR